MNLWVKEFNLEADSLRPRKRPMSLASPSIILDGAGNVRMVIGAAGGKYIATALSQVNNMYLLPESLEWEIYGALSICTENSVIPVGNQMEWRFLLEIIHYHTLSYIIIHYHTLSYIIIHYHTLVLVG